MPKQCQCSTPKYVSDSQLGMTSEPTDAPTPVQTINPNDPTTIPSVAPSLQPSLATINPTVIPAITPSLQPSLVTGKSGNTDSVLVDVMSTNVHQHISTTKQYHTISGMYKEIKPMKET
eukprot:979763_1